jgi:hypothetical protein
LATSKLTASLYDSAGNPLPAPSFTWTSAAPDVATVDPDGTVHAVAPGAAVITATDGAHGTRSLDVTVTTTPASGPTGVSFGVPIVILNVGDTNQPSVALNDATGSPVSGTSPIQLVAGGSAALDLSQPGTISATGPGMSVVGANLGASAIDGEMLVVVRASPRAAGGSTGANANMPPPPTLFLESCIPEWPPARYSKPGLSGPVRVWTWSDSGVGVSGPVGQLQQQSPTQVRVEHPEVASIGGSGLLTANAPGSTLVSTHINAMECGLPWSVLVGPDLSGSWAATCKNGDTGTISVQSWPSWIMGAPITHGASGGGTAPIDIGEPALSCFTNADGSSCMDNAFLGPVPPAVWGGLWGQASQGACTATSPCSGIGVPDCDSARQCPPTLPGGGCSADQVLGPDHLIVGNCDCIRSSSSDGGTCGQGAPATGMATYTFQGVTHTFPEVGISSGLDKITPSGFLDISWDDPSASNDAGLSNSLELQLLTVPALGTSGTYTNERALVETPQGLYFSNTDLVVNVSAKDNGMVMLLPGLSVPTVFISGTATGSFHLSTCCDPDASLCDLDASLCSQSEQLSSATFTGVVIVQQ